MALITEGIIKAFISSNDDTFHTDFLSAIYVKRQRDRIVVVFCCFDFHFGQRLPFFRIILLDNLDGTSN